MLQGCSSCCGSLSAKSSTATNVLWLLQPVTYSLPALLPASIYWVSWEKVLQGEGR